MLKRLLISTLMLVCTSANANMPQVDSGQLMRLENFKSNFVPSRNIDIWLPPGYSNKRQYPVVYMHDGQMLFDEKTTWNGQEWEIDEVAGQLIKNHQIPPFIVVGIFNGDANRHSEYFPQKPFESLPSDLQAQLFQKERSKGVKLFNNKVYSDRYLKFIVQELMPYMESNYPINAKQSYLLGSSMGGLISWYGLLEYPDKFAGAAALSTHWPGDFSHANNPIPPYFQAYIKKHLTRLNGHKIYFDHGTETLDALYPAMQKKVDQIFIKQNYPVGLWFSKEFTGTNHSENAWAKRVEVPLRFLLNQ